MKVFLQKKIIFAISSLPLWLGYLFSDFVFLLLKYFIKYRKKVIIENLKNSFPEKSDKEINQIANRFYRNLCDYFIESIKALTIPQKEISKRIRCTNLEVMEDIQARGKNCMWICGHIFNWEWLAGLVDAVPTRDTYAVFHPVKSPLANELTQYAREKYGTFAIPMHETYKQLLNIENDGNSAFLFVADQSPHASKVQYSLNFLNQETPVFNGFDLIARKKDFVPTYIRMKRKGRGKYEVELVEIKPDNTKFEPNEIVNKFFSLLEKDIQKAPDNWLWSHKRWKYKKGRDY